MRNYWAYCGPKWESITGLPIFCLEAVRQSGLIPDRGSSYTNKRQTSILRFEVAAFR